MIYQNAEVINFRKKDDEFEDVLPRQNCVIFLNIDGVIQAYSSNLRHSYSMSDVCRYLSQKYHDNIYLDMADYDVCAAYYDWNATSIGQIRDLARTLNAAIIIHSSWIDENDLNKMKALFRFYGLEDLIVDIVNPHMEKKDSIKQYLKEHSEIIDYVVIDDDRYLIQHIGCRQVLTNNLMNYEDVRFARLIVNEEYYFNITNHRLSLYTCEHLHDGTATKEVISAKLFTNQYNQLLISDIHVNETFKDKTVFYTKMFVSELLKLSQETNNLPIICKWTELEHLDSKYSDIFMYHMHKCNPNRTCEWYDPDLNENISFIVPDNIFFENIEYEHTKLSKDMENMVRNYLKSNKLTES